MGYVAQKIRASRKNILADLAKCRLQDLLERKRKAEGPPKPIPLLDYFVEVSPELSRPTWLEPYADVLSNAIGGNLRIVFAAPPQHGKTELTLRALLWWAKYFPGKRHAYVTYNQDRAEAVAKDFQALAEAAGLNPTGTLAEIHLEGGTRIKFTSIGGSLTGFPITGVCIVDDPFKDRSDAESPTQRRRARSWFNSVARTRRHAGTSFIVMATRWHVDDLSGQLVKPGKGKVAFRYINLKAICEPANDNDVGPDGRVISDPLHRHPGESLWSAKPPEFFDEDREDDYEWSALFQGEPRSRGATVFGEPSFYTALPVDGYSVAFGVDLAFSEKTQSDWSVCVEMWRKGDDFYVVNVWAEQVQAPDFADTLRRAKGKRTGVKFYWYFSGGEKGSADFINRWTDVHIVARPAVVSKFTRAIPTAAAWNQKPLRTQGDDVDDPEAKRVIKRLLVPDTAIFDAPWLAKYLDRLQSFTGTPGEKDDEVDASVAVFDGLNKPANDNAVGTATRERVKFSSGRSGIGGASRR